MEFPTHIVAAAGYIFSNDKKKILMVNVNDRGWDVPGGQIENGESIEEGLFREIREESGASARIDGLVAIYSNVKGHMGYNDMYVPTKVMFDFICTYTGGELCHDDEIKEVRWVDVEKALKLVTSEVIRYRLKKVLDFNGSITYASYLTRPKFEIHSETTYNCTIK